MGSWSASTQWDAAANNLGYTPSWQMQMIAQGHHLLPWFDVPTPDMLCSTQTCLNNGSMVWLTYYQTAIQNAAALNLPISFVGTQWEQDLYTDPQYFNLPASTNPNVVAPDGTIQKMVSPFGPIGPWQSVGTTWGSSPMMQQLQAWYPNPPLVIFVSNNEASKLQWSDAEQDQHYLALYGTGQTDEFKREKVAQGWIDRYRALQQAWRNALTSSSWKNNSKFLGYEAFGPRHFGRWGGWTDYSLYNTNRIDPSPSTWDGGSPSYYLGINNPGRDDIVFSPQVEAMNYDFMLKEAYRLNPNFWFELSTWNGCDVYPTDPTYDSDCAALASQHSQLHPGPLRAAWCSSACGSPGLAWSEITGTGPSHDHRANHTLMRSWHAVDRVYTNPTLTSFWRNGQLVANTSRPHPYQSNIPVEYQAANRMFMLTTNLDPPQPWSLSTPIPVYALARVNGVAPQRQWLVYAFSPTRHRRAACRSPFPATEPLLLMRPWPARFISSMKQARA